MRIRKYIAASIHEALRSMRRELGENAVILGTRTFHPNNTDELIEVLAISEHELQGIQTSETPAHTTDPILLAHLHHELVALRQQVAQLEFRLRYNAEVEPLWQRLYNVLHMEGFTEDFLLHHLPPTTACSSWKELLAHARQCLTSHLQVAELPQPASQPLRLLLLGAPGAGKSSTLLKIALLYKLLHALPIQLIAADTYKLGALEQLQLFASIADVPLAEVYTLQELRQTLLQLPSSPMVVAVDIPGGNPLHTETLRLWRQYCEVVRPNAFYAVVSATDSLPVLRSLLQIWQSLGVKGLIVTKLDQEAGLGPLLQALELYPIPVVCLCSGPRIPDDIEPATMEALACRIGTTEE
ncbi:MAG: hypothetical protein NZ473_02780 [Candidatus Kapabacteria bacterium]|nr:hypothetical protein [Candidatus Kapabacteria bacterium]MCS7170102.1 hypothetical protein [Candidatus Kapabacteria bacterium]MDW7996199.1 hypothetical protein [Bacteroidota bacterium]MDW8224492.1 hypothetical protein [Bacteroidota bacterium]